MASPEIQIKALDKQMSAVEKKIDQYDKQFRQIDYGALVKQLDALEKSAKHQAERIDKLEKLVSLMATTLKDPKKFLKESGGLDEDTISKMHKAAMEREIEKYKKEAEKNTAKAISDGFKALVEARLKALETLISALKR